MATIKILVERGGIRRKVTLQLKVNLRTCFFRDQNTQILFDKLLLRVPEVGGFHFQRKRKQEMKMRIRASEIIFRRKKGIEKES
jgi:hypothetical protein